MTRQSEEPASIPEEMRARLARPTVRLSGSVGHPMVASFFDQLLPVLDVKGSILVELFTDGEDAEIGRRLAEEVRLLRQEHGRDVWFLGKTFVPSAGVTVMAAFPKAKPWLTAPQLSDPWPQNGQGSAARRASRQLSASAVPGRLTSAPQLALIFAPHDVLTELVIIGRGFPSISICNEVIMAATVGPEVMARETARLIASDKVEGTAVRRSNGDKLGTIQRVMIDKRSGKVAYAVMTFGGFLGIGDEYRALPWSVLRYNERLDAYELNVTEDQLRNAPVLATGWDTGVIGRDWERNIHDYYRASPYW